MPRPFRDGGERPERPSDPAVRRDNLRRIAALFRPYRARLGAVLGLILISAALGVVPAFLLRGVLEAIPAHDTYKLSVLAGGMIVIAIVTGVLGVWQTLLSNQVGQRVMHDLRTAVFRHLQRLSLAFFTRTRTGEVQSRISNDIGGVQNVVTSTATSIVSNVTTVAATMIGMIALSWELSVFAFALIPIFVLLTRRVGNERRKIAKSTQETLADISSLVQESLSVSGILLGKTMGRTNELADRFDAESQLLADLEVRQRMAGRWMMAMIQTTFAVLPAAVYWFGGLALAHGSTAITVPTLVAFTTLQTRLFFPVGSLLGVGLEVQTSLALFDRIFEYLDHPIDITEAEHPVDAVAGDVAFNDKQLVHGVRDFASAANRKKYPCFLIAPQCPDGKRWVEVDWSAETHVMPEEGAERTAALGAGADREAAQGILPRRQAVYVTGLSMGGFGTWDLLCRKPKLFAAGVPICRRGRRRKQAKKIAKIPIWAFHGDKDDAVKVARTRNMIAALRKAGGAPKYNEYKGVGHDSWTATYRDKEMMKWLFAQMRK